MRLTLAAMVLVLLAPFARAQTPAMEGIYGGGYGAPPDYIYTQLDLKSANGAITGTMSQPFFRANPIELSEVRTDGNRIQFKADNLSFDLQRTGDGYSGAVRVAGGPPQRIAFVLRPGTPKPEVLAKYEGTYDLGNGRLLTLSRGTLTGGLFYLDLPSGRTGFLFNSSDTAFRAGMCFYCVDPVRLRITVTTDHEGYAESLTVTEGSAVTVARRARLSREEEVSFVSRDGTRLAGSLYLPMGPGPYPALVMTHGSGAQSRNGFYGTMHFLAEAYARAGIAVLAYDKRGVGGSQGDWEKASLADLADDMAAGVAALRTRHDIDPMRVGLTGSSQAGWIIPMAASRSHDIALMQIRSGSSPMGIEESEWRRLVLQMQSDHASQAEIDAALKIRHMMDAYTKTGLGWDELVAAFKPVENEYWAANYIGGLPPRDAPDWPWLKEVFTVDTTEDFRRWHGPLQFLYAGHDFVPVAQAKPMLEAALGTPRANVMIAVAPRANHDYYDARSASDRDFSGLSQYVPGYFDCVTGWAAARFDLPSGKDADAACAQLIHG